MSRATILGTLVAVGVMSMTVLARPQAGAQAPNIVEVQKLKDNLFVLTGGGGNNGHVGAFSGMINLLYDVDTGSAWAPYLGVGLGAVRYKASGLQPTTGTTLNDSDTVFAGQGILGVLPASSTNTAPAQAMAAGTSSSMATTPVMLEVGCRKRSMTTPSLASQCARLATLTTLDASASLRRGSSRWVNKK